MKVRKNILAAVGALAMTWCVEVNANPQSAWVYQNITVPAQEGCAAETESMVDYAGCVLVVFISIRESYQSNFDYFAPQVRVPPLVYQQYCSSLMFGCEGTIAYVDTLEDVISELSLQLEIWHP